MCSLQRLRSTCAPFRSWASSLLLAVGSTPDLPRRPRGLCLYPALCHSLHLVAHTLRLLRRRPHRVPPPAPGASTPPPGDPAARSAGQESPRSRRIAPVRANRRMAPEPTGRIGARGVFAGGPRRDGAVNGGTATVAKVVATESSKVYKCLGIESKEPRDRSKHHPT